jgi:hypothetical protein
LHKAVTFVAEAAAIAVPEAGGIKEQAGVDELALFSTHLKKEVLLVEITLVPVAPQGKSTVFTALNQAVNELTELQMNVAKGAGTGVMVQLAKEFSKAVSQAQH